MGFYDDMELFTYDMLDEYGTTMTIKHQLDAYADDNTGETFYNYLSFSVKGLQTAFSNIFVDGQQIQQGDSQILVDGRAGQPAIGDQVQVGDNLYTIINVSPQKPADDVLYHTIHARSYAVVDDPAVLTVDLGDLQTGTTVIENYRVGAETKWTVVAHNQHRKLMTTLVSFELFNRLVAFRGESGGWALEPWTATYLRRFLLADYTDTLSRELINNIQAVNVYTDNRISSETIFTLSADEMGRTPISGKDNGDLVAYFSHPASRIAAVPEEQGGINTSYWTRNAEASIGSDGEFASLNTLNAYGLRPAISLRSSLNTIRNFKGEYELQLIT
jgi:hypothetical protein